MSTALAEAWTPERFMDWVATQEERYEFDGVAPVGMVGATTNHNRIALNIITGLRNRLRGGACQVFGLEAGLRTDSSIRYPDALVTCTRQAGASCLVTGARVVFEVLSPSTERTDRITKVREYAAVPGILRYALVETRFPAVTVLHRAAGTQPWTALPLALEDTLALPEAGVELHVAAIYEDVDFPEPG